jgi:protoporphyrinogen oxidase
VFGGDAFISTMALGELVQRLEPQPPAEVLGAARRLRHRAFVLVGLIADQREVFRDNWIYVHDPSVRVGRIQNFKNWSPAMVPDARFTSLGLEYFAAESGDLLDWKDEDLTALAKREVAALGLLDERRVVDSVVVRERKAYPIYDLDYRDNVEIIRRWLARHARNLQVVGRNGMHKYDNQDHAMLTGLLAARNVLGANFDPWRVNSDAEYLEEQYDENVEAHVA